MFKVKKKANINYYKLTDDSKDDTRFKFSFGGGPEKEPEYSYNWPYDYFSLVELVNVEGGFIFDSDDFDEQSSGLVRPIQSNNFFQSYRENVPARSTPNEAGNIVDRLNQEAKDRLRNRNIGNFSPLDRALNNLTTAGLPFNTNTSQPNLNTSDTTIGLPKVNFANTTGAKTIMNSNILDDKDKLT